MMAGLISPVHIAYGKKVNGERNSDGNESCSSRAYCPTNIVLPCQELL